MFYYEVADKDIERKRNNRLLQLAFMFSIVNIH